MKAVVGALKLELSQYEEVARFARFGTEVNETTQRQIDRGAAFSIIGSGTQPASEDHRSGAMFFNHSRFHGRNRA